MPNFFIKRPNFALVIAIFIALAGLLAISSLPVAQYPSVAPPQVIIKATYPGASAEVINNTVISLIEEELNGAKGLLYYESQSNSAGVAETTVTFEPGTNPDLAQVDVQNRIKRVESRLPQAVVQQGLQLEQASSSFLLIYALTYKDAGKDQVGLADYAARNINNEIRRVPGVGRVQMFAAERALRIWIDPAKLVGYGLSVDEVNKAIAAQNMQVSGGSTGEQPSPSEQEITASIMVEGQLSSIPEFEAIVLRANPDGSTVRLGDVARVEMGRQDYRMSSRLNGQPAAAMGVQLAPGANALETAQGIKTRLAELSKNFPSDVSYSVPFDTSIFVKVAISKVLMTLAEAVVLVFLVMLLFLQNLRYTLIPTIVVPVCLAGTLAVMYALGFSVNMMTMFGMVLAIGIIVDDAIVVVENVERLMAEEGLSPRDATLKAMKEITGAIVGITLVLTAVFIPMAFASGSVGVIYQQFTLSMAVSILFSAFLALSLTPALCATLLKPVAAGHHEKKGFFGWFNRGFERLTNRYEAHVTGLVRRTGRMMLLFAAIVAILVFALRQLPSAFLPEEDQGYFMASIQLPADATAERTLDIVKRYEEHVAQRPGIASSISVLGFSFAGSGPNAAMAFTTLKDWDQRNGATAGEEVALAQKAMEHAPEGAIMVLQPPAIDELGTSSGFTMYLQDRTGQGHAALKSATDQLLALAADSSVLGSAYQDSLPSGTSVRLEIDRHKAQALGVGFAAISETLSTAMGSLYVNDFPNAGRMQQVIVQADAPARMQVEDVLRLNVRNAAGGMVPLAEFATPVWSETPLQLVRYQGFLASRISGTPAPGTSSGAAMAEMERLAAQLPPGFAVAWTGQSLQERQSAAQAPLLMALSMLVVFLVLAALYESWSIPLSVMLVVPLGLLGAVAAVLLRGMPNDVFFKVGLITIIGLSAKNAILIVEFAKQLREEGMGLREAAIKAARLRLRPILMTSLAFALGVVPLMLASGASAETQHAIGTGVFGGMVSGTVLAVFFVPVFFVFVLEWQRRIAGPRGSARRPPPAADPGT